MHWQQQFERELDAAQRARAAGNEGRARVCARRAAGIAVREFLERTGLKAAGSSVLDMYELLLREPTLTPELRGRIDLLALKVDREFKLPPDVDLIYEAKALAAALLDRASDVG
jgi:hypothetical protein